MASWGISRRVWTLNAPAYGLNDAPVAFRRTLKRYLPYIKDSPKSADLQLEASEFDTCLFFVHRSSGPAAGVITTHIDDLLSCGETEVSDGPLRPRERSKG